MSEGLTGSNRQFRKVCVMKLSHFRGSLQMVFPQPSCRVRGTLRRFPDAWNTIGRIETQVIQGERSADLLLVVVMLVHYARPMPFAKDAPLESAGRTGHLNQLHGPCRMRLHGNISRNRGLSNGYQ